MDMTVKLMPVGTPTANDRVYPLDVVLKMIDDAKPRIEGKTLFMHLLPEPHGAPTLNSVIGVVTRLFVDDGFLQADFFYLDDKRLPAEAETTISCVGLVSPENVVSDAKLSHLLAVDPRYRLDHAMSVSTSGTV